MDHNQFGETRRTTAFFVTRAAAEKAVRDLSAIGYGPDRVTLEASASAEGGLAQSDAERGEGGGASHGFIVRVDATSADYERVSAILDDDATVSMDARNAVRSGGSFFASNGGGRSGGARRPAGASADVHVPSYDEVMGYVRDKPLHAIGIAFMIGFVFGRR
ncbi:hypothetical protein GCM10007036_28910 [Alsobacter metallidurans]|uniref:Uncharacterized protein n=1 Tax=Alsobacter metallidurans TaxID=340221 RepID=A0A917I9H2_9HYPH|nr:hypothetical protein [Alsobacter metallidurans]GGH23274.1 hypothetical protein GCM10007036_28910 [Alsobacter metallidurans]